MQNFIESLISRAIFAGNDPKKDIAKMKSNIDQILELANIELDEVQKEKCRTAIKEACKDNKKLAKYVKEKLK